MLSIIIYTILSIFTIFFIIPWLLFALLPILIIIGGAVYFVFSIKDYLKRYKNKYVKKKIESLTFLNGKVLYLISNKKLEGYSSERIIRKKKLSKTNNFFPKQNSINNNRQRRLWSNRLYLYKLTLERLFL